MSVERIQRVFPIQKQRVSLLDKKINKTFELFLSVMRKFGKSLGSSYNNRYGFCITTFEPMLGFQPNFGRFWLCLQTVCSSIFIGIGERVVELCVKNYCADVKAHVLTIRITE